MIIIITFIYRPSMYEVAEDYVWKCRWESITLAKKLAHLPGYNRHRFQNIGNSTENLINLLPIFHFELHVLFRLRIHTQLKPKHIH